MYFCWVIRESIFRSFFFLPLLFSCLEIYLLEFLFSFEHKFFSFFQIHLCYSARNLKKKKKTTSKNKFWHLVKDSIFYYLIFLLITIKILKSQSCHIFQTQVFTLFFFPFILPNLLLMKSVKKKIINFSCLSYLIHLSVFVSLIVLDWLQKVSFSTIWNYFLFFFFFPCLPGETPIFFYFQLFVSHYVIVQIEKQEEWVLSSFNFT